MKDNTSLTAETRRLSMFQETKIEKAKELLSGRDMVDQTRDGLLSILTSKPRKRLLEAVDTDSKSIRHSTSDQDFQ
jgi:hypothetical protein